MLSPSNVPDYVKSLFAENDLVFLYSDNDRDDAVYGYTWRIYPKNIYGYFATFERTVERMVEWAQRHGAEANVLYTRKVVKGAVKSRRGDFIIFTCTDPVALVLEKLNLFPSKFVA